MTFTFAFAFSEGFLDLSSLVAMQRLRAKGPEMLITKYDFALSVCVIISFTFHLSAHLQFNFNDHIIFPTVLSNL